MFFFFFFLNFLIPTYFDSVQEINMHISLSTLVLLLHKVRIRATHKARNVFFVKLMQQILFTWIYFFEDPKDHIRIL